MSLLFVLALVACSDGDAVIPPGNGPCVINCDTVANTVAFSVLVNALGIPVSDIETNAVGEDGKPVITAATGTSMKLEGGTTYTVTAGSLGDLAADDTPLYRDDRTWAAMPLLVEYDSVEELVYLYGTSQYGEDPLIDPVPVVDGGATTTMDLRLYFNLGAANCHYEIDDWEYDYEQDDFSVKAGHQFEVQGVVDGETWIEIDENNNLVYGGRLSGDTITSSNIDQENGIIAYTESRRGAIVTCE